MQMKDMQAAIASYKKTGKISGAKQSAVDKARKEALEQAFGKKGV